MPVTALTPTATTENLLHRLRRRRLPPDEYSEVPGDLLCAGLGWSVRMHPPVTAMMTMQT